MSSPSPGRAAAPWVVVVLLVAATVAASVVVVDAVRGIAESFLNLPPLGGTEWVRRVVRLSSQELAFGVAAGALATAAAGAAIIALATVVIRRGVRVTAGPWLAGPAVLGVVLVIAAVRLAQQQSVTPTFNRIGVTLLLTSSDARGIPSVAVTLGSAGMLVLAATAGCAGAASRIANVACAVIAAALVVATIAAVVLAAAPVDALMRAPTYPARTIEPDQVPAAMASILGLGAASFTLAALASAAARVRPRIRPRTASR